MKTDLDLYGLIYHKPVEKGELPRQVGFLRYNHPMLSEVKLPPPEWINHPDILSKKAAGLSNLTVLAVDTESNGLHAYREQVCLIQLSDGQWDTIIDPLVLKDLSALAPVFANPKVEKVFHACEYDILCLKRDFGFSFCNIFDTMIASRILGYSAVGLGAMLAAEFGLDLDKRYQQANWAQRPLNKAMLEYARYDVHFLPALRDRLRERLVETGYLALAEEDFTRLCHVHCKAEPNSTLDLVWRAAGQQELTPVQAAVLKELVEYREAYAKKLNIPTYKVLSNAQLVDVAINSPVSLVDLAENCNLSLSLIERHGNNLVRAVQNGLSGHPIRRPARQKPSYEYLERLDTLRNWRKNTAHGLKVESDIVLPRDILEEIAARNPSDLQELQEIMSQVPWRYETYKTAILNLLSSQPNH